jgi:hypothetical protein
MNADEESIDNGAPSPSRVADALMGAFVVFPTVGFWASLGFGWGFVWAGVASGIVGFLLGSE